MSPSLIFLDTSVENIQKLIKVIFGCRFNVRRVKLKTPTKNEPSQRVFSQNVAMNEARPAEVPVQNIWYSTLDPNGFLHSHFRVFWNRNETSFPEDSSEKELSNEVRIA